MEEALQEALTQKEPITVICSSKGWIRAMKGHQLNAGDFKYKEGDTGQFVLEAMSTDKLIAFATNGRFYTLGGDKLPPGRGFGEPVRLMVDLPNDAEIVAHVCVYNPERQSCWLSRMTGAGLVVPGAEVLAQTRQRQAGAQRRCAGTEAIVCVWRRAGQRRPSGDHRRKPQDAGLPDRRSAGNDKGQGRHPAEFANGGVI